MKEIGGFNCIALHYSVSAAADLSPHNNFRECRCITGGNPNAPPIFAIEGFRYTEGSPAKFARSDVEKPFMSHFFANCGIGIGSPIPAW